MSSPVKVIAGITVPFTPLIEKAIEYAKSESPLWLFNHVMRSWLFAIKISQVEGIAVDGETLAVATLLHDLGLVPKHLTPERRFEVDGAAAAVTFLHTNCGEAGGAQPGSGEHHKHKLREVLVWDAIALHTTSSLAEHTLPEVTLCHRGIGLDFMGKGLVKLSGEMNAINVVLREFPRLEMKDDFKDVLCALARDKPQTTYDNMVSLFGMAFVDGYTIPREVGTQIVVGLETAFET